VRGADGTAFGLALGSLGGAVRQVVSGRPLPPHSHQD